MRFEAVTAAFLAEDYIPSAKPDIDCSTGLSPAPEFSIAYNSLSLMYNQAALWLGMLFSPPLAAIVTLKFFLLFYVKKAVVMHACQPARKVWRAAQTQTVLYMMVNLSLFVTLFALGSLFMRSSAQCGPFREFARVYEVVTEGALRLEERHALRRLLGAVTRPGVIAFLMLFLAVWAYYARAQARAQRSMVQILRQMLVLEAKDKEFLLSAIAKVSNGEWQYSRKAAPTPGADGGGRGEGEAEAVADDSYTWRYLRGEHVRTPANVAYQLDARRARPRSQPSARPVHPDDGDSDSSFSWRGSGERPSNSDKWL
ncbi:Transmembrane channel-like protein 7 [Eumeta japonica]|uniref:Transmembrane channel-like protein 7 n=1 Tax=Eumeta variegata TaxID=151549 RepID=A0A4C1ZEZ4_EUMVA|nr:Transmembrane channel-like protein 7 [Eumeta japonica]